MTRTSTATRRREAARTKTAATTAPATTPGEPPQPVAGNLPIEQAEPTPSAVKPTKPATPRAATKLALIIAALRSEEGATVPALVDLTGWKTNSVRGVLAGALKTKFGLTITSTKTDGVRVYRVAEDREG